MRLPLVVLLTSALSACAVGPDYRPPQIPLTAAYVAPGPLDAADAQWWRRFGDPLLDRIVDRVLGQNFDLAAASARIAQSRAAASGAGAALLPSLDVGASAQTASQSLHSPFGAASSQLGFPRGYDLYQAGAQASWEIDLFGGLSRRQQAARADLAATSADAAALRLSVVAEAVDAYLQLRGLQARLAVAENQRGVEQSLVGLVRQRAAEGLSAERELNRALGEQQGIEAAIPPLRAAIAGQMNRLDVLMGTQAGTWRGELSAPGAIPLAPDASGSADPAELLRRRPDVAAAEQRLIAANARIGASLAAYYPHLSLSGLFNVVSLGTGSLFTGGAVEASGGAGLRWRLFDFGRIDAEVAEARGAEAERLALYRATVARATAEVETALVGLTEGRAQVTALAQQVAALSRARDQTRIAYESGAVALLDVLDADRALLDASDRLAQARAEAARASVAAVRALGGGYQEV